MNNPATIEGIALIASTIIRTGRASRPPTSLRNTAVATPSGTESRVGDADHLERTRDRGRAAALGRRAQRPDVALVLHEELGSQRVVAAGDRVADDEAQRDQHAQPDRRDDDADQSVTGLDPAQALPRDEPRRREEHGVPRDAEPEQSRKRGEALVDQPRQAERADRGTDEVDGVRTPECAGEAGSREVRRE